MDKELIKMCDCPEIQGMWEPKVGDVYFYTPTKTILPVDMQFIRTCNELGMPSSDMRLYIPRIEDVLGWLGDRVSSLHNHISNWTVAHQYFNGLDRCLDLCGDEGDTLLKALLKAFMHLEHNKTWNGEAWH
jgi:hypothetical protein